MIVKSLSRRSNSAQLIQYALRYIIDAEKSIKQNPDQKKSPLIIRHNIRSRTSIAGMIKEFQENEKYRLYKRKDSVKLFHTILSLSSLDKEKVTDKLLKDLAKKYISLRGENNLYVGAPHYNTDAVHIHLVVSGTQLNGRSSRISKQQFKHIKLALDAYQKEKYPELIHSLPEHGKGKRKTKEEIVQTIKSERQTNKQSLITSLDTIYQHSSSLAEFLSQIQAQRHTPYYRNGKLQGVLEGDKKYRLSRLGFDVTKLQAFPPQKTPEEATLTELQSIRKGRSKQIKRDLDIVEPELREATENREDATMLEELASIRTIEKRKDRSRDIFAHEHERNDGKKETSITEDNSENNTSHSVEHDTALTI